MRYNHYIGFYHGSRGKPRVSEKSEAYLMGYASGCAHKGVEDMRTEDGVSREFLCWLEAASKLGLT